MYIPRKISQIISYPVIQFVSIKTLINLSGQKLILLVYHAVSDKYLPHISNLYEIRNSNKFLSDIEYVLKYFNPIDLNKLIEIVKNNKKVTHPCFHLSFDDGLSEFYHVVAPLLVKKGVPATCFLNSAFIDNKDLFFRYKESIIADRIIHNNCDEAILKRISEILKTDNSSVVKLKSSILKIKYDQQFVLDDIAKELKIDFKEYLKINKPYLSKEQIKELQSQGFTFGAHSIDHPEYRYLPIEEQVNQTVKSMNDVKKLFNLDYSVFAFPFTDVGVSTEFFNKIDVDLSFGCSGIKKDVVKTNLHRIPIEDSNDSVKNRIKSEYIYYLLKKPLNKNVLQRN